MAYRFRTQLRRPMRLEAFSVLARVLRHAAYAPDAPADQPSLWSIHHDLQSCLRSGHPEWIHNDRLHVRRGDREAVVVVDMRNTQYIGADQTIPAFHLGYEPDIALAIETWVPDDGVFLDVGANWGYFAVFLAVRPGFAGKILAIEPFPASFEGLASVVGSSGLQHLIEPIQVAAGRDIGSVSMSEEIFSGINQITDGGSIPVRQTTIDALVQERGMTRLDFIKIDVEGAEPDAIRGAADSIARYKPAIMFESWRGQESAAGRASFDVLAGIERYEFFTLDIDLPTADFVRSAVSDTGIVSCAGTISETSADERDRWPERINVLATPCGSDFIARLKARAC